MIARYEELDWQKTRMGELMLRRRADPATGEMIYEVRLEDEYLMSSLFTVAEEELATLGLAAATGDRLNVLVGGLGLGRKGSGNTPSKCATNPSSTRRFSSSDRISGVPCRCATAKFHVGTAGEVSYQLGET